MTNASFSSHQELLNNETVLLRDSLRGLELSVAITNYGNSLFALNEDGEINEEDPGLFVVILDEVARRAGFTWRNRYAAVDPIRKGENRTWNELLEWEVKHFDIAVDHWDRSTYRMSRSVNFPHGWYDGSIVVGTLDPKEKAIDLWSFLKPFDVYVWLVVAATIVGTGLVYFFLERMNADADAKELSNNPNVAIFYAAITFTGHHEFEPNTNAARIISFSWTFWALIMASAYTGKYRPVKIWDAFFFY